ncbi:ATP-dependent nuclease [Vagococcus fluvialis]|uniref:ATP-dependent nuclease n=1 Tax=Vagococcus fluvialis TaxID=2738 RepID=UPI0037B2A568
MKISKLKIENYRNIRFIDVNLGDTVALIGRNNSGKSNILRAVTLPFLSNEIGYNGKNLSWFDINSDARNSYYNYIFENQESIRNGSIEISELQKEIPRIVIEVGLLPNEDEYYFVKDLAYRVSDDDNIHYGIKYEFSPRNFNEFFERIKEILNHQENVDLNNQNIDEIKMNLLPVDLYSYTIKVPFKLSSVPFDTLKLFKYTSLIAERDDFSQSSKKIGSNSLVKLLQMKLDTPAKITIEQEYTKFFEKLKEISDMDNILNWHENSEIDNAQNFFNNISILPNMPNMGSLLNSVKLGYSGDHLSSQGLGNRNLILLFVLLNSFLARKDDTAFSLITMEEPEAHLCIENQKLMSSYMENFNDKKFSNQLLYSTHSTEFINKLNFNNIIIVDNGNALSLESELEQKHKDYLSKNPNLDLYKLFFSSKCILVEGLTEELFIRAYLQSKGELNNIEVLSFHKGYIDIMKIWLKLNKNSKNRLGIIRDFDDQPKAMHKHEAYNQYDNICVTTTSEYTLEPEIVNTGNNIDILNDYFASRFKWEKLDDEDLSNKWRNAKASIMLEFCKDLANGNLENLEIPIHIQKVLDFMS